MDDELVEMFFKVQTNPWFHVIVSDVFREFYFWLVGVNIYMLPLDQMICWVDNKFHFSYGDMLIHLPIKAANPNCTFIVCISSLKNIKI